MPILKQIICACVLVCGLLSIATAQESVSSSTQRSPLTITAAAAGDRVRITAPSSIVQMHVEVYAAGGEKLFDQEIRGGNVVDWHLQDGQGQRLAPGSYVCVVTAKSISGKLTQKIGTVNVEEKSVSVQPAASSQLSVQQTQTIGPMEENSSWTIPSNEPQTATVIAHDGTDGQMIRGRGALTFRIGNFFTGIDTEQMRLTEAGNLGIGTSSPQAKLDVAGAIRAERFLIVKPKPAGADKTEANAVSADAVDPGQSLISGTGTQDRIAKWTDNAGTLGDSGITETSGGFVGIGTTTPDSKLVVSSNSATLPPATGIARFADANGVQTAVFADAFGTNPIFNVRRANGTAAAPSALQANQLIGVIGASGYGASAYMGTRARVGFFASENWTNTANGTYLTFNTTGNGTATAGGSERLRIDNTGNVGLGTSAPRVKLEVNGDALVTTAVGGEIQFGTPGAETGMSIKSGGNRGDVRFNGLTLNLVAGFGTGAAPPTNGIAIDAAGNVGIGTTTQQNKLVVNAGGLGGAVNFGTPNGESGMAIIGTNRADVRFDGTTLKLLAGTGPGAMASTNGINIDRTGNVGIGIINPGAKLHVVAGSSTAIHATSQGNAVIGLSSTANFAAIYGENTSGTSGFGLYGKATGGYAMYAEGNAAQSRDKGGWVKAMALINRDGVVVRCYNSQLAGSAASTLPCGITVQHSVSSGQYNVTFSSLQVDDRFISVTASKDTDYMVANIGNIVGNTVEVDIALNSETNGNAQNFSPAQFTIFIF
ncbi:MAG: trimeric autotransporter adhesin [Blastocatellia bacterium]|nr:trimeric autotransporter adhesin [Blastocatellia bacterium]